jgi:hypothetical protein
MTGSISGSSFPASCAIKAVVLIVMQHTSANAVIGIILRY